MNVHRLAMWLFDKYPERFTYINREFLRIYSLNHDRAKTNQENLVFIAEHVGQNVDNLDEATRNAFLKFKAQLNAQDTEISIGILDSLHVAIDTNSMALYEYALIVDIADKVERGMNPFARLEFNKAMQLGSKYLTNPVHKWLARVLEARYFDITHMSREFNIGRLSSQCIIGFSGVNGPLPFFK